MFIWGGPVFTTAPLFHRLRNASLWTAKIFNNNRQQGTPRMTLFCQLNLPTSHSSWTLRHMICWLN
ncbi:hypothetical protein BH09SUM1_BH09SUM1_20160 [soil metagenome]